MDAESDQDARARLNEAMSERRLDLGLRWNQVSDRAGMTYGNLHKIRIGAIAITDEAKRGLERALQWQKGSIDAILAGKTPTPIQMDESPLTDDELITVHRFYLRKYRNPREAMKRLREDLNRTDEIARLERLFTQT